MEQYRASKTSRATPKPSQGSPAPSCFLRLLCFFPWEGGILQFLSVKVSRSGQCLFSRQQAPWTERFRCGLLSVTAKAFLPATGAWGTLICLVSLLSAVLHFLLLSVLSSEASLLSLPQPSLNTLSLSLVHSLSSRISLRPALTADLWWEHSGPQLGIC